MLSLYGDKFGCDVYLSTKKQRPFTVVSEQNDNEKRIFQVQCVLIIAPLFWSTCSLFSVITAVSIYYISIFFLNWKINVLVLIRKKEKWWVRVKIPYHQKNTFISYVSQDSIWWGAWHFFVVVVKIRWGSWWEPRPFFRGLIYVIVLVQVFVNPDVEIFIFWYCSSRVYLTLMVQI